MADNESGQKTHKPGQIVDKSGYYEAVGPRGHRTGRGIHANQGKHFPPTPKQGESWVKGEE